MKLPGNIQKAMTEDAGLSDDERAEKRKRESTPLPKGTYLFKCVRTEDIEADENRQYDQVRIDWQVVEPEEDDEGNDLTKRKVVEYVSLSENASWKMRQIFDAAGYEYDSDTEELSDDEVEVIGVVTWYKPTRGKNKNTDQHQIQEYFPPDANVQIGLDDA